MVSSSKGTREVQVEHYRKLGTPTANETFDAEFDNDNQRVGRGDVDASRGRQWFGRITERVHKGRSKEVSC